MTKEADSTSKKPWVVDAVRRFTHIAKSGTYSMYVGDYILSSEDLRAAADEMNKLTERDRRFRRYEEMEREVIRHLFKLGFNNELNEDLESIEFNLDPETAIAVYRPRFHVDLVTFTRFTVNGEDLSDD